MVTFSIRLQPETKRQLKSAAAKHGLTPAEYARMILSLAANGQIELMLKQNAPTGRLATEGGRK